MDQNTKAENLVDVEFVKWRSIKRPEKNTIIITEKMDGTNGCIIIKDGIIIGVQSRTKLLSIDDDNYGFFAWCAEHAAHIIDVLGDGRHYGEFCGPGINKNRHDLGQRAFFIFNTFVYPTIPESAYIKKIDLIYTGKYSDLEIRKASFYINLRGMRFGYCPEGFVVFYEAFGGYIKHITRSTDMRKNKVCKCCRTLLYRVLEGDKHG